MRKLLGLCLVCAALVAACGDDSSNSTPAPQAGQGELPADAQVVTTPEGDQVYTSQSTAMVYGSCDVIAPHEDDLAGWLDVKPPRGYSDYGSACR